MIEKSTTRDNKNFTIDEIDQSISRQSNNDVEFEQFTNVESKQSFVISTTMFDFNIETIVIDDSSTIIDNDNIDYKILLIVEKRKIVKLKIKRKFEIAMQRNKHLMIFLKKNEFTQTQFKNKRRDRV